MTPVLYKSQVQVDETTRKTGTAVVAPISQSLEEICKYTDQGLVVVYHPNYNSVTVHHKDDVIIDWSRPPVCTG